MKFLVLFACVAVASAQLVTHPNGAVTPAETPSVAAAKAAHFNAKGLYAGYPYAGYPYAHGYAGYAHGYAGYPYAAGYTGYPYAHAYGYPYAGHLVTHPNGAVVPADTPDVAAAKAEHFAEKGVAYAAGAPYYAGAYAAYGAYPYATGYAAYPYAHGYAAGYAYPGLVGHPNGALVPAEPADVVAARAEHLSHF